MPRLMTVEEQAQRTQLWTSMVTDIMEFRATIAEEFPELKPANHDHLLATIIIGNNLGEEWVAANIDAADQPPAKFLNSKPKDLFERHVHYMRVMELARRIVELAPEGFAERVFANLRRRDLRGAVFEADVVRMLYALPSIVDLREPRGVKGDDYDIDIWLGPDRSCPVEVKTREDGPYSERALARTLEKARPQLPSDGLGVVFLKVPHPWLDRGDYRRTHRDVVNHYLRGTSRVHAVVLVWDSWKPKTFGSGWNWTRRWQKFLSPAADPIIQHLFGFYERAWNAPIDIGPTAPF